MFMGYQYNCNNSGPPVESHYRSRSDISDRNGRSSSLRRSTSRGYRLSPPPRSSNISSRAEEILKRSPKAEPSRLDKADFSRSGRRRNRRRNRRSKPYEPRKIVDGATNASGDATTNSNPGKFETEIGIIPKLPKWEGKPLTTCSEAEIPKTYKLTVLLPRSAGQDIEKALSLIANQNGNLNTDKWKVLNHRDCQRVIVMIDEKSWEAMKANGNKLAYRFKIVKMQDLKYLEANKTAEEPDIKKEDVGKTANKLTILLPFSAGHEIEKALSLIANQNEGLNTDKWKVLNHRVCHRVIVMIDEKSWEAIEANGNKLANRFKKAKNQGLKYLEANKIAEESDIKKEDVGKTANGDVTVKKEANDNGNAEEQKDDGNYVVVKEEQYGDVTVKKEANDNGNAEEHKDDGYYIVVKEEQYGDEEKVYVDEEVEDETLDTMT